MIATAGTRAARPRAVPQQVTDARARMLAAGTPRSAGASGGTLDAVLTLLLDTAQADVGGVRKPTPLTLVRLGADPGGADDAMLVDLLALVPSSPRRAALGRELLGRVLGGLLRLDYRVRCTILEDPAPLQDPRGREKLAGGTRYVAGSFAAWARLAGMATA